jgi:O-antigen biosynthesis protein WbqP
VKRLADIVTAGAGLLVLSPLLLVGWLAVRLESAGPGFFRQRRIGRYGEEFEIVKFRSMAKDAPEVATDLLPADGNHVTRVGRFLRATSIDELPNLWNVLLGQMSVIGPRPALWNQLELTERRREHGVLALRPGLTGLAQVMGRDDLADDEKVAFDAEYLQRVSLATDVRILWQTIAAVFSGRGAR